MFSIETVVPMHKMHAYKNVLKRRFIIFNKLIIHIADRKQYLIVPGIFLLYKISDMFL